MHLAHKGDSQIIQSLQCLGFTGECRRSYFEVNTTFNGKMGAGAGRLGGWYATM